MKKEMGLIQQGKAGALSYTVGTTGLTRGEWGLCFLLDLIQQASRQLMGLTLKNPLAPKFQLDLTTFEVGVK